MVPDEMVAQFCLAGTPDEVAGQWAVLEAEYEARGVTETVFQLVGDSGAVDETVGSLNAIVDVLGPRAAASS